MIAKQTISTQIIEEFSHLLFDNLGIYYSRERWP
jgi:hypothetical protein